MAYIKHSTFNLIVMVINFITMYKKIIFSTIHMGTTKIYFTGKLKLQENPAYVQKKPEEKVIMNL